MSSIVSCSSAVTIDASVGRVGQMNLPLMIEQTNLSGRVVLDTRERGHDEAVAILSEVDVLLHPSKTEGFGMPVLEMQAVGVPVITTKHGAMSDFNFNGIAVPPLDQLEWLSWSVRTCGHVPSPHAAAHTVRAHARSLGGRRHGDVP